MKKFSSIAMIALMLFSVFNVGSVGAVDATAPTITLTASDITANSATLSATTDEAATCKYYDSEVEYDLMTLLDTPDGLSHSTSLIGLSPVTAYTYYVRCRDLANNEASSSTSFTTNAECGNGIPEEGEVCDSDSQPCTDDFGYSGSQNCAGDCSGYDFCSAMEFCGDLILNGNEVCDSDSQPCTDDFGYSGSQSCLGDCSNYDSECIAYESCGDGMVNGPEQCEFNEDCGPGYGCDGCQCVEIPDSEPATINSVTITPDNYACFIDGRDNLNGEITLSADVTDNLGVSWVKADISSINPMVVAEAAENLVDLVYNEGTGKYEYTFTVSDTSQYNFEAKEIIITADDEAGNGYQVPEGSSNVASVILYSLTYPTLDTSCEEYGATTSSTNFCDIADWHNVNLIQEVKKSGLPENCDGEDMPWGDEYRSIFKLEFSSLDLANPETISKLQNLGSAIQVHITPPGQTGDSYINVDTEAFAELNSATMVNLYGLPFSTEPQIISPEGRAAAVIQNFMQNDPYSIGLECYEWDTGEVCDPDTNFETCECESYQSVPSGDLTFIVEGFSQYDITDPVLPNIVINDISENQYLQGASINFNTDIDGTGTQLGNIIVQLNGEEKYSLGYTDVFNTCTNGDNSGNFGVINCPFTFTELEEGTYTLTVIATDLGGENGNTNTAEVNFQVDNTPPQATLTSPTENQLLSGVVTFTVDVNDGEGQSGIQKVEYYDEGTGYIGTADEEPYSLEVDTAEITEAGEVWPDDNYQIYAKVYDNAGNYVETAPVSVLVDNTAPMTYISYSDNYDGESWVNSDVTITLTTDNDAEGSGLKETLYCLDQTNTCQPNLVYGEGGIIVSDNSYILYHSIDQAGNEEEIYSEHILIDKSAPLEKYTLVSPAEVTAGNSVKIVTKVVDEDSGLSSLPSAMLVGVFRVEGIGGTLLEVTDLGNNIYQVEVDTTDLEAKGYPVEFTASDQVGQQKVYETTFTVVSETTEENFLEENLVLIGDANTTINAPEVNTTIELEAADDLTTSFAIVGTTDNSNANPDATDLDKFIEISAPEIEDNMNTAVIKVYYTDAEVTAKGLDETTLRLWYFDGTNWIKYDGTDGTAPDGGVDTTNNYVWALSDHFSTWGVFGTAPVTTTTTTGGGGGGIRRITPKTTTPAEELPITPLEETLPVKEETKGRTFRASLPKETEEEEITTVAQTSRRNNSFGSMITGAVTGVFNVRENPLVGVGVLMLVVILLFFGYEVVNSAFVKKEEKVLKKVLHKKYFRWVVALCIILTIIFALVFYTINQTFSQQAKMNSFAQCLSEEKVVYYSSSVACRGCPVQEEIFGNAQQYLTTVDCAEKLTDCKNKGVRVVPSWQIKGKIYEGVKEVEELATLSGCSFI